MANITNLWETYGVTGPAIGSTYGIRESLADTITIIDPDDQPTVAVLEKTTTNALYHEYLIDSLAATSTAGSPEGDSFSAAALNTRTRLGNTVQRFRKDFAVSLDQIELSKRGTVAGVRNEMDYQATKASKELLRNVDARLWSTGSAAASAVGVSSTTAPTAALLANIRQWGYVSGITANQSGSFSTAALYALHQAMYATGAKPDTIFCNPYTRANISRVLLGDRAYATANTGTTNGLALVNAEGFIANGEYGPVIEYVKTEYGRMAIVMDRWIPRVTATASASAARDGGCWALIEKAKVRLAYWRPLKAYPIAPQGDYMAAYMLAALTLEVLHPSCIGIAYNATD